MKQSKFNCQNFPILKNAKSTAKCNCRHDKEHLVRSYERHEDYFILADALGINRRIAYCIIRRYLRDGLIERRRGGPHHQIVDQEMKDAVVAIVEDHSEFTVEQINQELRRRLPNKRRVCNNIASNMLHCRLITLKFVEDVPAQRNSTQVKTARC